MHSDPKPEGRIKNPALLRQLHLRWRECALCGATYQLSLHHISKHPRDDTEPNLVMLCGSGTTGCHGSVEAHNAQKLRELGGYLLAERLDSIAYLVERKGLEPAEEWFSESFF